MNGSDNGLLPAQHPAIIWNNADLLKVEPRRIRFSEIVTKIYTFSLKKMPSKMSFANWCPFCADLIVLILSVWPTNPPYPNHSVWDARTPPFPSLISLPGIVICARLLQWNMDLSGCQEIPFFIGLSSVVPHWRQFLGSDGLLPCWRQHKQTETSNKPITVWGQEICLVGQPWLD